MNNKTTLTKGVIDTLNGLSNDYGRLHKAILFYLHLADDTIEYTDKVYTLPEPSIHGWFKYGCNFNVEVSNIIDDLHGKINARYDNNYSMISTRDSILLGLLDYMGSWTAGG